MAAFLLRKLKGSYILYQFTMSELAQLNIYRIVDIAELKYCKELLCETTYYSIAVLFSLYRFPLLH